MAKLSQGFLLILSALVLSTSVVFAEEITITSYFPSPYGVYKNLRLYPNDDSTPGAACTNAGEMYYDNSDQKLYICSGATWKVSPGGTSGTVSQPYYCFNAAVQGSPVCTDAGGAQGWCPAGFTQSAALGNWGWGQCGGGGYWYFIPPGGGAGTCASGTSGTLGRAYMCTPS